MKTKSNLLTTLAFASLVWVATTIPASAFNQDHFFIHKTVSGQHNGVNGIAVGPDDKIYVADYHNQRFAIYDAELNLTNTVSGFRCHDIIVSTDGIVYAADPDGSKVRRFDASGTPLSDLTTEFSAHYVRIHPGNGNLYIRDNGTSYRVCQPDGTVVKSFTIPDGSLYLILPDGRLQLTSGTIYNDLGIQERSGLPGGADIRYAAGVTYLSNEYNGGYIDLYNADMQSIARIGARGGYWNYSGWPWIGSRFCINHKGDVIGTDGATLWYIRRCEGNSMGPEVRNSPPLAEVTGIAQRPNTTLLDIDYKITDMDDATVQVAAAAFTSNTNSLDNMILLNTLVEGTAAKVGPALATGTVHRLTWDVGADWGADFGDLSVHIFTRDARTSLMGLHFLDLPAEGSVPAIKITRSPVHSSWFLEPLMWLVASKNPTVVFSMAGTTGNIHGTNDAPDGFKGELLASSTSVTQKGRQFIESLMGTHEATAQEVQGAREAATPGVVNQWDPGAVTTKRIDGDRPRNLNEYSFDTGNYDAEWFWLVKN